MKCPKCNREKFVEKEIRFTPVFKDEEVDVLAPSLVCTSCEHAIMNTAQMNDFRKLTADAYREKHSLLTSFEGSTF